MHPQHQRTLEALFAHPLQHGVRVSRADALLHSLGAEITPLDGGRLRIRMPAGQETWIHPGCGLRRPDLDSEAVMRLRHLLKESGISPTYPGAAPAAPRGDQSLRLVVHLDHTGTRLWRLEGERVEASELHPHGVWGSGENLSHRHERDIAGQRAPVDEAYLQAIITAIASAESVLLVGHGHGQSDMRQLLLHRLRSHRPDLMERITGIVGVDSSALSEAQLLALAKEHFGNLPQRRARLIPGQEPSMG